MDRLAEQLFLMHMVQHIPAARSRRDPVHPRLHPNPAAARAATRRGQAVERALGPLAHPASAVVLYVAVIWLWHVPALYDATIRNEFRQPCGSQRLSRPPENRSRMVGLDEEQQSAEHRASKRLLTIRRGRRIDCPPAPLLGALELQELGACVIDLECGVLDCEAFV